MVTLQKASILSIFFEAVLYGFSVLMFIITMWILIKNRHRRPLNYAMLGSSCLLLVLSTAEMAVNVVRIFQAFFSIGPTLPDGPEQYLGNMLQPTFLTKQCLYYAQSLIVDGVVIYRVYAVWQNLLVAFVPILGWCGLLAASIGTNVARLSPPTYSNSLFALETTPWIIALYAFNLGTNFISTTLLAYKLWSVSHRISRYRSSSGVAPILRVVIESGAIYSATVFAGLILFILRNNGTYIVLDMTSPITSIVFNMIVVRVGLAKECQKRRGNTSETVQRSSSFAAVTALPHMHHHHDESQRSSAAGDDVELEDVTVKIARLVENELQHAGDGVGAQSGEDTRDLKRTGSILSASPDEPFHVISGEDLA